MSATEPAAGSRQAVVDLPKSRWQLFLSATLLGGWIAFLAWMALG